MLEKTLYNQLFSRSFSLPVEVNYWDGTTKQYGDTDTPPQIKINIHEEIPMKEITSNASLALGEAYMDHRIEIEGSIQALINDAYQQANSFLRGKDYLKWLPKKEKHTKQKNKEDIHAHYDLGNDFYKLWLDPTLTYSCAYFNTPEDTLEQAQINKVHHILDKLFIKEVARNIEVQSPVWETRGIVDRQSGKSFVIAVIQQLQKCLESVEYPSLGICRQANTFFNDFDPIGFISCHDGTIAEVQFYSVISGS